MNARDRELLTATHDENSRTAEDRARVIRIRARQARAIALERQIRASRTPGRAAR